VDHAVANVIEHRENAHRAAASGMRWCVPFVQCVILAAAVFPSPARAAERELDQDPPPSSASEIESPIQRMFPEEPVRSPLFPWVRNRLQKLPAFIADTVFEARFRTYYLRKDRTTSLLGDDGLSEAWAMGGSIYYRSGWLEDLFQVEVEGFTSQPIVAPEDRAATRCCSRPCRKAMASSASPTASSATRDWFSLDIASTSTFRM
jgi:hypothetical protein